MILYGTSLSPFVRKVLVFAAEKGVTLEVVPVMPGAPTPEFLEASPFRKMPALRDGDFTVSDSSAIVAYLDALHPEPNLIPTEARARARCVWFDEFADTLIQPAGAKIVFNRMVAKLMGREGDESAAVAAETNDVPPLLDYLEGVIADGGYLVEDRFTLADIAVVSPLTTMAYARWRCDAERHPKVHAYVGRVQARPSFAGLMAKERAFLQARAA